ncbi:MULTISPECIES: DUF4197 domain-containing protein [unclassified Nitratiruptor]|uniref:DUF4197 domain-containing protein n=1 Tax=unclassified Nitratiruptor TaxID=2624044 RepID=UPI00191670C8|nr:MULTISPECIES: DUF4197 domain-containing protein [unclassified Nitratiruptor]BCD60611.1 hypothetical protein NitYY0810_C1386 [Nitratiruptor sp. YY08-10]BCD64542.1 hypothetical protein NitYY0814_C1393 [Nitratiruptor sp. YY08-14]
MRKFIFSALCCALLAHAGWLETLQSFTTPVNKKNSSKQNIDDAKAQSAMKDALKVGIQEAIKQLGKEDGFYKNSLVKIPIPSNMQLMSNTLKKVGLGKYVDAFERSMNRAAEEAIPETASILYDTLKNIDTKKAKELIFSQKEDAITDYFKEHAGKQLAQKIAPIIKKHVEKEQVTKYYQTIVKYYNQYGQNSFINNAMQFIGKSNEPIKEKDLTSYVTNRTLQGLFTMLAQKEKAIRTSPIARTTRTLQEVFGALH